MYCAFEFGLSFYFLKHQMATVGHNLVFFFFWCVQVVQKKKKTFWRRKLRISKPWQTTGRFGFGVKSLFWTSNLSQGHQALPLLTFVLPLLCKRRKILIKMLILLTLSWRGTSKGHGSRLKKDLASYSRLISLTLNMKWAVYTPIHTSVWMHNTCMLHNFFFLAASSVTG